MLGCLFHQKRPSMARLYSEKMKNGGSIAFFQ